MEIEYSLFVFTTLFLFLNLLNSCFIYRRFATVERKLKFLEDYQQQSNRIQQTIVDTNTPSTIRSNTPVPNQQITNYQYPQTIYPPVAYTQPYSSYQAPSAPPYYPPRQAQGPQL
jgi:hypothetical protein